MACCIGFSIFDANGATTAVTVVAIGGRRIAATAADATKQVVGRGLQDGAEVVEMDEDVKALDVGVQMAKLDCKA